MILVTHGVIGRALAHSVFLEHPVLAFVAGFLSHFVMDMIPHWDYHISAETKPGSLENNFSISWKHIVSILKIILDFASGIILPVLLFPPFSLAILLGAFGGVLPDILQFVYWKTKRPLFLQKFHHWIHAKRNFNGRPYIGASMQIGIIAMAFYLSRFIR